ncbi:MAG: hypothetical protein A2275_14650 [Bacteroidetes bacterium RIFOXYA12_FULL_35_11]|nr:MAG: hypothetical protein A2X01_11730 [Bacteroidetes bacterium GWF2_35_48]OFY80048.1 MAG: hypothetical protein A2275_14650 [Bacteroidetes bacterium RIFOXYA12_FULL_35_11]OFZ02295.1 MAG: hypothetical protein A2491_12520 [Bacteroidetes bacterium RIFOXYC12_FULL_35_7]
MKGLGFFLLLAFIAINLFSQTKGTMTDSRDKKTYKTVTIGTQTWIAENMKFNTGKNFWCYQNKSENCDKYGGLYGWEASKTVCPPGWHLPSKTEWEKLFEAAGGEGPKAYSNLVEGGKMGFNASFIGSLGDSIKFYDFGMYGYYRTKTETEKYADYSWYVSFGKKNKMAVVYNDYKADGVAVRCVKD